MSSAGLVPFDHADLLGLHDVATSTVEDRLRLVEAKIAITEVLNAYCAYYDAGRLEGLHDVFTSDAVLHNLIGTHEGRDAVVSAVNDLATLLSERAHCITNVVIRVVEPDLAFAASALLSIARKDSGGLLYGTAGTYFDVLRRDVDGRWRIAVRRTRGFLDHELTPLDPDFDRFAELRDR